MHRFKFLLFLVFLLILAIFSWREIETRKIYQFEGQILSCQYKEARSYCSFLKTVSGEKFLLTPGSEDEIGKEKLKEIYGRRVLVWGNLLSQEIPVLGEGNLERFKVIRLKFI
jgi:hypothetical protein